MALSRQHDVLQFKVPVHNAKFVQVVNGKDQLGSEKFDRLLVEDTLALEEEIKFSTTVEFVQKTKAASGLEGTMKMGQKFAASVLILPHLCGDGLRPKGWCVRERD